MANLGQGDPHCHRRTGDSRRTAVDLHVDDDGGLVRSDDERHAGHDGSGNDAVAAGSGCLEREHFSASSQLNEGGSFLRPDFVGRLTSADFFGERA